MDTKVIQMKRVKETKNTFRYEASASDNDVPTLTTIYLPKWYCKGVDRVEVTVKEAK